MLERIIKYLLRFQRFESVSFFLCPLLTAKCDGATGRYCDDCICPACSHQGAHAIKSCSKFMSGASGFVKHGLVNKSYCCHVCEHKEKCTHRCKYYDYIQIGINDKSVKIT